MKAIFILILTCSSLHLVSQDSSVEEIRDISYYAGPGSTEKHKLDLYVPEGIESPPVLLWIHGGAWAFGGRSREAQLAREFAKSGVAVAAVSYRLSPALWASPVKKDGIQHPEHIRDIAKAFKWLHDNTDEYGLSSDIWVSGYSAGAHLSALLVLDPRYLNEVGKTVTDIKGTVPIAGAYDLLAYYADHKRANGELFADQHVKGIFGEANRQLEQASVTTWIENSKLPMFVISESQTFVYTKVLEDKVAELGVEGIEFWHIRNETHNSLWESLSSTSSLYRDKIVEYINSKG